MVDLADEQAAVGRFEQVDREQSARVARHRPRGAPAEIIDRGGDLETRGLSAASGVGDPVFAPPLDRGDRRSADHENTQIAAGLIDVFLNVENSVLHGTERRLVLHDRFRGIAVVHASEKASPRTDRRLEDNRIPHSFDRFECGFRIDRHPNARRGDAVSGEDERSGELVAAGFDDRARIDARNAEGLEHAHGGDGLRLADAALKDRVEALPRRRIVDFGLELGDVEQLELDAAAFEFFDEQAFFNADAGVEEADAHGGSGRGRRLSQRHREGKRLKDRKASRQRGIKASSGKNHSPQSS